MKSSRHKICVYSSNKFRIDRDWIIRDWLKILVRMLVFHGIRGFIIV